MSTLDLKRRLLLSKWRGRSERTIAAERVERLLADVETLNAAVGKLTAQDEKIATLESDLDEKREEIKSLEDDRDSYAEQLETVLCDVRYWLHDGIVLHKIVSDPRALLRKVEGVLS